MIEAEYLNKQFLVTEKQPGLVGALKSFVKRRTRVVTAVEKVSFCLDAGEVVGFLGPNGAGKTTTLKMLSGLLHPSGGRATVAGFNPIDRRSAFLRSITLVMGQKSQLMWDLTPLDSFMLLQAVYDISDRNFQTSIGEFTELLDLTDLLKKPVRNLSLGERMKCELVAALLHRPKVMFLDEPTIGVDITMQLRIREFIAEYNRQTGATVLLTSHYMADVTALCKRIIVIDKGRLVFDGDLNALVAASSPEKTIKVQLSEQVDQATLASLGRLQD
jgi:ABC-2 type transport system ATP-binding protein